MRNRAALQGYVTRVKLFASLPTFQDSMSTLDVLRRQLACDASSKDPPREKRYPYLDRGLQEFMYSIPREQLIRPGRRRSLMRRALIGIVPDELLNRKRKAYVTRGPLADISDQWTSLLELSQCMFTSSLRITDSQKFIDVLQKARHRQDVPIVPLMRTLWVELWLRNLGDWKVLSNAGSFGRAPTIPG